MDVLHMHQWTCTVTYRDGSSQVFFAQDLDAFRNLMVTYLRNAEGSSMYSVLIH